MRKDLEQFLGDSDELLGIPENRIIIWPDSQELYDLPWYEECVLVNSQEGLDLYGSCTFIIPEERVKEFNKLITKK